MGRFTNGIPWRFLFTDLNIVTTTWADGLLSDRHVVFAGNQAAVITGAVNPDDIRVNLLLEDGYPRIAQSNRIVYGFRREGGSPPWVPRAAGILMSPEDSGDPDVPLTHFTAYDPWKYLEGRPVTDSSGNQPGPDGFLDLTHGNEIALQYLKNTIENEGGVFIDAGEAWGGTSSYAGTIETTDLVAMTTPQGQSVADVWNTLCSTGNMDIKLTPIYDPARTITVDGKDYHFTHEISIFKIAGVKRPAALMSWDKLNRSVTQIQRMHDGTPGAFFNKGQYFPGDSGAAVPFTGPLVNAESVDAFGAYWALQFFPALTSTDPTGSATLALLKQALVMSKQGRRTLTVTPLAGRAKEPLTGYEIFDLIPIHASKKLRVTADGYFKVQSIPISITDDGVETVEGIVTSPDYRVPAEE